MTNKHKPREEVWAVIRFDAFALNNPEDAFTIKKIVRSKAIAEAEVDRLNRVNADKGCRYWLQMGRLFPEGQCAGPSSTDDADPVESS